MSTNVPAPKAVFTPDEESYLGRQSVFHFDQVIVSGLEANADVAAFTREHDIVQGFNCDDEFLPLSQTQKRLEQRIAHLVYVTKR